MRLDFEEGADKFGDLNLRVFDRLKGINSIEKTVNGVLDRQTKMIDMNQEMEKQRQTGAAKLLYEQGVPLDAIDTTNVDMDELANHATEVDRQREINRRFTENFKQREKHFAFNAEQKNRELNYKEQKTKEKEDKAKALIEKQKEVARYGGQIAANMSNKDLIEEYKLAVSAGDEEAIKLYASALKIQNNWKTDGIGAEIPRTPSAVANDIFGKKEDLPLDRKNNATTILTALETGTPDEQEKAIAAAKAEFPDAFKNIPVTEEEKLKTLEEKRKEFLPNVKYAKLYPGSVMDSPSIDWDNIPNKDLFVKNLIAESEHQIEKLGEKDPIRVKKLTALINSLKRNGGDINLKDPQEVAIQFKKYLKNFKNIK